MEDNLIFDSDGLYIPQTWVDDLDNFTSLSPERLDHMEQGIYGVSEKTAEISRDFSDFRDSISHNELFKIVTFNFSNKGQGYLNFEMPIYEDFSPIGVTQWVTGNGRLFIEMAYLVGNNLIILLKNFNSDTTMTDSGYVKLLYLRNNL